MRGWCQPIRKRNGLELGFGRKRLNIVIAANALWRYFAASMTKPDKSSPGNVPTKHRRVIMLAFPGADLLDITGPLDIFSGANTLLPRTQSGLPAYGVELVAHEIGPVETSSGIKLLAERRYVDLECRDIDTVMIAGGLSFEKAVNDHQLLDWIRHNAVCARRLASICTGAFLLAEAGILDGRRATTHWAFSESLARRFPNIEVEPDALFIRDGNIYTSAGITAGMDLALSLIEEDYGREIALTVARIFVLFLKRPGGQSQFSIQLAMQQSESPVMQELQKWVLDNLSTDLTVEVLAKRASMSPRNFARVFKAEFRVTPAAFVESARLEAARRSLEESDHSIETVSIACGFKSPDRMRRAFLRHVGVSPQDYRKRFQSGDSL